MQPSSISSLMSVFKAVASMKQAGVSRCNTVDCGGHCIKRGEHGDICGNFVAFGKDTCRACPGCTSDASSGNSWQQQRRRVSALCRHHWRQARVSGPVPRHEILHERPRSRGSRHRCQLGAPLPWCELRPSRRNCSTRVARYAGPQQRSSGSQHSLACTRHYAAVDVRQDACSHMRIHLQL
jgi:hypothetical protein